MTSPGDALADVAAEVATEVRLLRAVQTELAGHAAEWEAYYREVGLGQLIRLERGRRTGARRRHV